MNPHAKIQYVRRDCTILQYRVRRIYPGRYLFNLFNTPENLSPGSIRFNYSAVLKRWRGYTIQHNKLTLQNILVSNIVRIRWYLFIEWIKYITKYLILFSIEVQHILISVISPADILFNKTSGTIFPRLCHATSPCNKCFMSTYKKAVDARPSQRDIAGAELYYSKVWPNIDNAWRIPWWVSLPKSS